MNILSIVLAVAGLVIAIIGLKQEMRRSLLRLLLIGLGSATALAGALGVGYHLGSKQSHPLLLEYTHPQTSVTTYAGSGEAGNEDGMGAAASFFTPEGIDVDNDGNVYVTEFDNNFIRRIDREQNVSILCGSLEAGYQDGPLEKSQFRAPSDVCFDQSGNRVLVAEWGNHSIRSVNLDAGTVTTIAGLPGEPGVTDGIGSEARFLVPSGLDCTSDGIIFVAEFAANRIRRIDRDGTVSVFAGATCPGYRDGDRITHARFSGPMDVLVVDDRKLLVADYYNNEIRSIDLSTGNVTTIGGTGEFGKRDGAIEQAQLYAPSNIVWDKKRNCYYIVDSGNNAIRILYEDRITTLVGGRKAGIQDGLASEALFNVPMSMCQLNNGDWLITDSGNNRIRRIHFDPER